MPVRSTAVTVHPGIRFDNAKLVDIYCPAAPLPPVVLLWHGSGPNERNVLSPLARAIASNGMAVVVPDWQADDERARRAQLLSSISFVLSRCGEFGWSSQVVLGGWSFGASAALDLVLHPETIGGWRPAGCLGIAGPYDASPLRNGPVCEHITADAASPACLCTALATKPFRSVDHSSSTDSSAERVGRARFTNSIPTMRASSARATRH